MLEPSSSEDENDDIGKPDLSTGSPIGGGGREATIHAIHANQHHASPHHLVNHSSPSLPRCVSPAISSTINDPVVSSLRASSQDRLSFTGSRLAGFSRSVSPSPSSVSNDTVNTSSTMAHAAMGGSRGSIADTGGVGSASVSGSVSGIASGLSKTSNIGSTGSGIGTLASGSASEINKSIDESEKVEKEEQERKMRLQLYVFVIRCVSYPFNAKQPTDMVRRPLKVTKLQLEQLIARFNSFLKGETQIPCDDAFIQIVQNYYTKFLSSDRCQIMVNSGASSLNDFRSIFRSAVEKWVKSLPEIDGLSKETLLNSWISKFEILIRGDELDSKKVPGSGPSSTTSSRSQQTLTQQAQQSVSTQQANMASEMMLTKEQLYDMFQHVLNIKKFEHQLLYNALQVRISLSLNLMMICCLVLLNTIIPD